MLLWKELLLKSWLWVCGSTGFQGKPPILILETTKKKKALKNHMIKEKLKHTITSSWDNAAKIRELWDATYSTCTKWTINKIIIYHMKKT